MQSNIDLSKIPVEREVRFGVHPIILLNEEPTIAACEYPYSHIQQSNLANSKVAKALDEFKESSGLMLNAMNGELRCVRDNIISILEVLRKSEIKRIYIRVRKTRNPISGEEIGEITLKWGNPEDMKENSHGDKILREYPLPITVGLANKLLRKSSIHKNRFHLGGNSGEKRELDVFLGKEFLLHINDTFHLPFMSMEVEKDGDKGVELPPYAIVKLNSSIFPFGTSSLQKTPISKVSNDTMSRYYNLLNLGYMNYLHR